MFEQLEAQVYEAMYEAYENELMVRYMELLMEWEIVAEEYAAANLSPPPPPEEPMPPTDMDAQSFLQVELTSRGIVGEYKNFEVVFPNGGHEYTYSCEWNKSLEGDIWVPVSMGWDVPVEVVSEGYGASAEGTMVEDLPTDETLENEIIQAAADAWMEERMMELEFSVTW